MQISWNHVHDQHDKCLSLIKVYCILKSFFFFFKSGWAVSETERNTDRESICVPWYMCPMYHVFFCPQTPHPSNPTSCYRSEGLQVCTVCQVEVDSGNLNLCLCTWTAGALPPKPYSLTFWPSYKMCRFWPFPVMSLWMSGHFLELCLSGIR